MDLTNPQIIMRNKEIAQLRAENARLREELATRESDVNIEQGWVTHWKEECDKLREQLAAAQATIKQMREKSEAAKNACMVASSGCSHIKTHAECNEARQFAHATKINVETALSALNEALALQPCPEVLNKVRAEAAMATIEWVWSKGSVIPREAYSYVKRIEQGKA